MVQNAFPFKAASLKMECSGSLKAFKASWTGLFPVRSHNCNHTSVTICYMVFIGLQHKTRDTEQDDLCHSEIDTVCGAHALAL